MGGADPLDLLPRLPSERRKVVVRAEPPTEPPVPAQASSGPAEAGRRAGASMAHRGLGCPPRGQHEALAAAAGIEPDDVPAFSAALVSAWAAASDQP